jgi:hypothetical protein
MCLNVTLQYIAGLVSFTTNMNFTAANYLLENEWRCISDEDHRMPLTLSRTILEGDNTTDSVHVNHSDATVTGRKRDAWCESALKLVMFYHNWKRLKFSIE